VSNPQPTPPPDESQRRAELLELKEKVSGLTPTEADELRRIPINVGGGGAIFVPRPFPSSPQGEADFERWAREREAQLQADPTHPHGKPSDWKPRL
jgi:hypothetical protein